MTGEHFIGAERSAESAKTFCAVNPATGEELSTRFYEATVSEGDRAVRLADEAFDDYRARTPEQIAVFLEVIADELEAIREPLLEQTAQETGLQKPRLQYEHRRTVDQARLFAEVVREGSWVAARIDHASDAPDALSNVDLRQMLIPLGPVAVFGASNFPLAISVVGNDTISALAAGCSVIVKAHQAHPATCEMLAEVVRRAIARTGMHDGLFSMVHGAGHDVGRQLVEHPLVRAVGFTGSLGGGRALFDVAMRRPEPIPFYAEMGSINPVFVLPGANDRAANERAEKIADGLVKSMTASCGQMCTSPGLLIATDGDPLDSLVARACESVRSSVPQTMLHPGIFAGFESGTNAFKEVAGVKLLTASESPKERAGYDVGPMLFETNSETLLSSRKLHEEVFGPASIIVRCKEQSEFEALARSLSGSLTATIHGTDEGLRVNRKLVSILERKAGRLIFNGFPTGVAVAHAMHHGGPYPATTDGRTTSIGTASISRWGRLVCYQQFPEAALPTQLLDANPQNVLRMEDGNFRRRASDSL